MGLLGSKKFGKSSAGKVKGEQGRISDMSESKEVAIIRLLRKTIVNYNGKSFRQRMIDD